MAKILPPKDYTHFAFFDWFPMKYVRGYIQLILITCAESQQFWKKTGKTSEKLFFLDPIANLHRKGVIMDHTQDEKKNFFGRNNISRSSVSESFYFTKIS